MNKCYWVFLADEGLFKVDCQEERVWIMYTPVENFLYCPFCAKEIEVDIVKDEEHVRRR